MQQSDSFANNRPAASMPEGRVSRAKSDNIQFRDADGK
jgi:hypothetical protein